MKTVIFHKNLGISFIVELPSGRIRSVKLSAFSAHRLSSPTFLHSHLSAIVICHRQSQHALTLRDLAQVGGLFVCCG
jgi:hypothetical protein